MVTYQANLYFAVSSEGCVTVNVSVVPGRVYSRAADSPLSLSFLRTNYLIGSNSFAVATNHEGVTVGQIQSDMIRIDYSNLSNVSSVDISVVACLLYDETMGESAEYDVFDVGVLMGDGATIRPLGLTNTRNLTTEENLKMCFSEVNLADVSTSLILVKRDLHFVSERANTRGEVAVVWASGALFSLGGVFVVVVHLLLPFNVAVFAAGMQGACLLVFRGVYFFVLAAGDIQIGGLLDFALIEVPTFIYIGIFLRIILVGYWVFFKFEDMSKASLFVSIAFALLVNWLVFAAIMIAASFADTASTVEKYCDCQLSGDVTQSDAAQIIRLVYKSFVFAVAVVVFFLTAVFGQKLVKGRNPQVYYQVLILSLGLLFDCLAFLVYYAVDEVSAYFLIALWFTELLPICVVNAMVAGGHVRFWISEQWRSISAGKGRSSSTQ